jgi:hypothetical protein
MEETLITFVTAKLAKQKGFDDVITNHLPYMLEGDDEGCIGASIYCKVYANCCTQSLLQKWLREIHEIIVEIKVGFDIEDGEIVYYYTPFIKRKESIDFVKHSGLLTSMFESKDNYEEALEFGLQQALKLIKEI